MLVNGQYIGISGATGEVDLSIDNDSHVSGDVTMHSFQDVMAKNGKAIPDIEITGSAEYDTAVCPNYPISGSVTVTIDGDSQTITFNPNCDGTFEGGSQGQTGDVAFRLTWSTAEDLDLYVREPSGEVIYFGNSVSDTNGQLDVDPNAGCSQDRTYNHTMPDGGVSQTYTHEY